MISVSYLIVCANLLFFFIKANSVFPTKSWRLVVKEQNILLRSITAENQDDYLARTVTPYWKLTYDEQLVKKQRRCHAIADSVVKRANISATFIVLRIVPSPVTKAYVNRDKFNLGLGLDGNPKTVGFTVGNPSLGRAFSIRPKKIVTIKEIHKRVAQVFEDFIRLSPLPANIYFNDGGHWRTIIVRSNEKGDVMACVIVQPKGFSNALIRKQQLALSKYFFKHLPNITLFHQQCIHSQCSHIIAPFVLLYGQQYLFETLKGYKFMISPESYFEINKSGAEVLYDTVIRTGNLKPNSTVLEIISRSGAISILASKFVKKVVGIDSLSVSIREAKFNAQLNNVRNVVFLKGNANTRVSLGLKLLKESREIVAILNIGYGRVGMDAILSIRNSTKISRVLYISSKPFHRTSINNFVDLCSNETSIFPPFTLTKIIPVDMLPQTLHFEIILLFQRSPIGNI